MRHAAGLLLLVACSSSQATTDGGSDASGDGTSSGDSSTGAKMFGTVSVYSPGSMQAPPPFPNATVTTSVGPTATSDNAGAYALFVPKGAPFTFTVVGEGHSKLIEQESILSGDAKRDESLVPTTVTGLLRNLLPNVDTMKAALTVGLIKKPSCKSALGATVSTNPPQMGSMVAYFSKAGFPESTQTTVFDDPMAMPPMTPRAILYNLDPKASFQIVVTWMMSDAGADAGSTGCKQTAYPVQDPEQSTLTYTGKFLLEAGDVVSYARVFLE